MRSKKMEAKKADRADKSIIRTISVFSVMILLAWASFFFYGRVIRENYDGAVGQFLNSLTKSGDQSLSSLTLKKRVLVLKSESTQRLFNSREEDEPYTVMWRNYLKQSSVSYEVVSEVDFLNKDISVYDTLVLPFAICLSSREIEKIRDFAGKERKGIILEGYTGCRDENGIWRDASFLSEVIGGYSFSDVANEESDSSVAYMIMDGTSMLSYDVPAGFRLGINTYNKPISSNIIEPRTNIDSYWEEKPYVYGNRKFSEISGMAHGNYLKARFVWISFTMGSIIGNPADQKVWAKVMENIMNYVSFRPLFFKDHWPSGKRAAVVFAEDTEDQFANAENAVNVLTEKGIPATFFCVPELASENKEVFRKIYSNKSFEIGLHGLDVYQGQPFDTQLERLSNGRAMLERLSGRKVRGFRPPEAIYDQNTLQALLDLNYDFIAGDDTKQASPEALLIQRKKGFSLGKNLKSLVKFPKTGDDDYDILVRYKMRNKAQMLESLKSDFDAIYKVGGLYYYSFHTQLMANEEYIGVISKFIDYIKTKNVWITNFGELNDWYEKWAFTDITSSQVSEKRTYLKVTNNSLEKIDAIKVNMILPPSVKLGSLSTERLGVNLPEYVSKDGTVVFDLRSIRSDESATFNVDCE